VLISSDQCRSVEGDLRNTLNVVGISARVLQGVDKLPSVVLHENGAES